MVCLVFFFVFFFFKQKTAYEMVGSDWSSDVCSSDLGMPLATDVVSGERADDPLYMPCIERVQASVGRHGLFYVGDCKMASRETRARIAAAGDFYLCPLPQVQLAEGEFDAALEAVCYGEHVLSAVVREGPKGQPELIAQGYEYP